MAEIVEALLIAGARQLMERTMQPWGLVLSTRLVDAARDVAYRDGIDSRSGGLWSRQR